MNRNEKAVAANNGSMKIDNVTRLNRGALIARFDLSLPSGMVIKQVTLLDGANGRWLGMPSREWTNQAGEKKYIQLVEFTDAAARKRFTDLVMPLVEAALEVE
jgi:DNA-binding cell septation regulator SpoVG